jgi:prevent-host-death family protein
MDIGVRELKQNLSSTLDRVAAGETVVVTDRGVPKAVISPIADTAGLERAIEDGRVRPARPGARIGAPLRIPSRRTALELLAEDRGE